MRSIITISHKIVIEFTQIYTIKLTGAGVPPAVEEHGVDVVAVGGGQLEPLAALLVDQLGAALGQRGSL